jgi:FixJ family two-component response regulator
MGSTEATVFVIDDDADVRDGLTRLLRSAGWSVVACAAAQEFLDTAIGDAPGCILLDVSMPGMTGPELHEQLRQKGVSLPVIYLTGNSDISTGVKAMKRGAVDFLEKPIDADALLPAIEDAIGRHRLICAERKRRDEIDRRLSKLSVREREVLDHVVIGRLNKQIAADLGIAEKTVKVHRGRVMTKMRVRSVAELVHICDELGIGRHAALRQPESA